MSLSELEGEDELELEDELEELELEDELVELEVSVLPSWLGSSSSGLSASFSSPIRSSSSKSERSSSASRLEKYWRVSSSVARRIARMRACRSEMVGINRNDEVEFSYCCTPYEEIGGTRRMFQILGEEPQGLKDEGLQEEGAEARDYKHAWWREGKRSYSVCFYNSTKVQPIY